MPVLIYEIAKKLGLESKEVLAKAKELGIAGAKVPSSSIDKITAEYLEEHLRRAHPELPPSPSSAAPPAPITVIQAPPMPPSEEFMQLQVGRPERPSKPPPKPTSRKPTPPRIVRISEVAQKVGLPLDQVQMIAEEFEITRPPAPDSLQENVAQGLIQLIQSGRVEEKRIKNLEQGGKRLNLRGFPLTESFVNRISHCRHAEVLSLANTSLSNLPDAFAGLSNLSELDLTGNVLEQLPKWLLELHQLRALYLHGNPLLEIPPEILGAPPGKENPARPRDILEYYFRLQSGGKRPLNEGKLILLGRGEVGKTSLVNRLVHDKFIETSMTCGIVITQWKLKVGCDTVRLHIWDFGGQEIQHATHQFFLTERSLYLVVLNGRAGAEDDDAEYWLRFIKTYGDSSPTIVVLNKFRVQPFEVDEAGLKEKYPFIRGFIETDCQEVGNIGIARLRESIDGALTAMDHVRVPFPDEWFQIKERLAEMSEPFISFKEYRNLCVSKNEGDSDAQEQLAVFLNALGIALNFRDDARLREETVLNPHWITKGVYRIITSPMLLKAKGELWLSSLGGVLPNDEYPPHMHLFLIELMRKFELCFPYHEDYQSHRYLVPELLGKKQPVLMDAFLPESCSNFRYDYRILPEGLLPRFITRTHAMSEAAERWRTGVILRWEGARALVKADRQERQVVVRVCGDLNKRRRLLAVIRENFDHIHREMKEFRPTEWIALEKDPNEWVNQKDLETFHKRNVFELPKAVGSEVLSINVTNVLNASDVEGAESLNLGLGLMKRRPIKAFLSYAHADEKWRAKIAPNLNLLTREGLLTIWCDLEIKPGHRWDDEIKRKLLEAELYIFLVSAALLDSEYVITIELPIAKQRENEQKGRLVPIVIRDCSWKRYLGDVQALPTGGRPIKKWADRDEAFFDVENGLRKTIREMHKVLDLS